MTNCSSQSCALFTICIKRSWLRDGKREEYPSVSFLYLHDLHDCGTSAVFLETAESADHVELLRQSMARPRHGDASEAKALPKALGLAQKMAMPTSSCGAISVRKRDKKLLNFLASASVCCASSRLKFAKQITSFVLTTWNLFCTSALMQRATSSLRKFSGSNVRLCNFSHFSEISLTKSYQVHSRSVLWSCWANIVSDLVTYCLETPSSPI
jgi:hypothetical protein